LREAICNTSRHGTTSEVLRTRFEHDEAAALKLLDARPPFRQTRELVRRQAIVAIAVEKNGRGLGRIRLQQIGDVSTDSLLPFVQGAVERGDGSHRRLEGYTGLAAVGYQHQVTVLSGGSDPAHEVMPRVHLVAALLKRWLIGTHPGGVQHQHLDYYLDEFTFRFNRRRSKAGGLLFDRLAQQALAVGPAPYNAKPPGSSDSRTTGQ
jgi:hypothetical protein